MSEKELHIYTRVSTRAQEIDGTSLDTQKALGEKVAKRLKLKPVLMNEGGKSSNHEEIDKRPVLQKLLLGIEEGTVRHLQVKQFWLQENAAAGELSIVKIPRAENCADALTHPWGISDIFVDDHGLLLHTTYAGTSGKPPLRLTLPRAIT